MADREKVIKGLEDSFINQGFGYMDGVGELYAVSGEILQNAIALLKEQDNWLGIHQTVDGITFISSGTAKHGEKRGTMLGKALVYERLEKELMYRGLLTDDIRSAFVKVWNEIGGDGDD